MHHRSAVLLTIISNGYNNGDKHQQNNYVLVTRVPIASVFSLNAYRYWNGSTWSPKRVYISSLTSNTNPHYLIGLNETGQGSAWYSSYYKKSFSHPIAFHPLSLTGFASQIRLHQQRPLLRRHSQRLRLGRQRPARPLEQQSPDL